MQGVRLVVMEGPETVAQAAEAVHAAAHAANRLVWRSCVQAWRADSSERWVVRCSDTLGSSNQWRTVHSNTLAPSARTNRCSSRLIPRSFDGSCVHPSRSTVSKEWACTSFSRRASQSRTPSSENPVAELDALLGDAGSAYQVREADDDAPAGLERAVDPTVADAFDAAVRTAEDSGRVTAGACLRSAWAKAYTLRPDPNGAYSDAVRAVEDVALPLFAGSRPDPTLGDVIREFRDNADAYELELLSAYAVPATITTVTDMLKLQALTQPGSGGRGAVVLGDDPELVLRGEGAALGLGSRVAAGIPAGHEGGAPVVPSQANPDLSGVSPHTDREGSRPG